MVSQLPHCLPVPRCLYLCSFSRQASRKPLVQTADCPPSCRRGSCNCDRPAAMCCSVGARSNADAHQLGWLGSSCRAPDFARACGRPGSAPLPTLGRRGCSGSKASWQPNQLFHGLQEWSAAAIIAAAGQYSMQGKQLVASEHQLQQHPDTVATAPRPCSAAALDYARQEQQRDWVRPQSAAASLAAGSMQLQHVKPCTVQLLLAMPRQQQRRCSNWQLANAVPQDSVSVWGGVGALGQPAMRAATFGPTRSLPSAAEAAPQSHGGLSPRRLHLLSSTGLAARVHGGTFAPKRQRLLLPCRMPEGSGGTASKDTTSEQPPLEVLGHVRRAPNWRLPPNRVATSRKWALAAAQAALQ